MHLFFSEFYSHVIEITNLGLQLGRWSHKNTLEKKISFSISVWLFLLNRHSRWSQIHVFDLSGVSEVIQNHILLQLCLSCFNQTNHADASSRMSFNPFPYFSSVKALHYIWEFWKACSELPLLAYWMLSLCPFVNLIINEDCLVTVIFIYQI